ncbi:hypothetical protein PV327_002923 [Microctonus hyperodae]|uniref:L-lactate dehydrogenase n=1 Tax=Microctonus hyperodae TaxID=165561 RepID=A0AA39G2X9_MICHY|nr:hypothetical protein PV327_002923 [Microctonus hyperodae]
MTDFYNCPPIRNSLSKRINSVIAKYIPQDQYFVPYSVSPKNLPLSVYESKPLSSSIKPLSMPQSVSICNQALSCKKIYLPSVTSALNRSYRKKPGLTSVSSSPAPNFQQFSSTRNIGPSLKEQLVFYNNCCCIRPPLCRPGSPLSTLKCPGTKILTFCQCADRKLNNYENRRIIRSNICCCPLKNRRTTRISGKLKDYSAPFSSRVLEREFTRRFRLASELVLIDTNESLAKAHAEDISHAGAFLGNPKIIGTKGELTFKIRKEKKMKGVRRSNCKGETQQYNQDDEDVLRKNFEIFKSLIPNVCKFAPNSILVIVSSPVDILSYAAMKLSGFPPTRVIGLGTFLDTCRFQCFIADKLGVSANSVQALIIGENGSTSVPVWSAVTVMGVKLKDINKEIGTKYDPEGWNELHNKVVNTNGNLIKNKGYCNWSVGLCVAEIVDAVIRNTCMCMTVSTFIKIANRDMWRNKVGQKENNV